ncbi:probable galacturonosyltransferase 7 isoform X1 [Elaeis guineensis]|uniref:probable galacturonosyltransferase 7 isoform X1 n=2 Tax=Elaeis guineensis var. tenera TaxID=51953 RepID=UPI003C6D50B7
MKGFVAASVPPAKRRWRGFAVAVLALVCCSVLVPLGFLLGFHNGFPSGYSSDDSSSLEIKFRRYGRLDGVRELPEDVIENTTFQAGGELHEETNNESFGNGVSLNLRLNHATSQSQLMDVTSLSESKDPIGQVAIEDVISHAKVVTTPQRVTSQPLLASNTKNDGKESRKNNIKSLTTDETERSCQLEFGTYCLWSWEHKEMMNDSTIKRLKDQLFVARAYYPSIAKLRGQENLTHELKQNIQEHEHMLSEAILDGDLPPLVARNIQKMDQTIARAKSCTVDCKNVDKKLRQILDLTEDEALFHKKQSAFLYHLSVQTMPKSLHCLSMRLTVEYFKSPPMDSASSHAHKFENPELRHYVIFSRNMLAASVAINSTVANSEATEDMVFHVLTDGQNYYAMKLWFARNSYKEATIRVLNFEELNNIKNEGTAKLSLTEEFHVSILDADKPSIQMRTEYLSVFGHSHFILPEIFKNLKKVVVLDDDVVVQHDLSSLWNLDLEGKVNGAVEFCGVKLGQLRTYLGRNIYDADSCAWISGFNILDLEKWREHNVTGTYLQLLQKLQTRGEASWRGAALPISLLAFQNLIHPLDDRWTLSGLGHDFGVNAEAIGNAVSLHYNGNMKPWLELGIPNYKKYWKKFLPQEERFMEECNVSP